MELKVINEQGQEAAKLQASDVLFGREFNEALVHQIVVAYQANARSGDSKQKDRSEVRHTTTKPWRQKGTGRARAGSNGSPLWRGGGRIFPNSPDQNYSQKVNKKMFRAGMAAILSELARQDRLVVVEKFGVDAPKTKELLTKLQALDLKDVLIVTPEVEENLFLAARNLYKVDVRDVTGIDPVSLIAFDKVLMTADAVKQIEEMLA